MRYTHPTQRLIKFSLHIGLPLKFDPAYSTLPAAPQASVLALSSRAILRIPCKLRHALKVAVSKIFLAGAFLNPSVADRHSRKRPARERTSSKEQNVCETEQVATKIAPNEIITRKSLRHWCVKALARSKTLRADLKFYPERLYYRIRRAAFNSPFAAAEAAKSAQLLFQKLVHLRGIKRALTLFHHLTYKEAE